MMRRSSLSVVAPLLVMCGVMHAQEPLRLYVAPGGNDAAAGRSIDAPFATLVRARDEIHRLKTAGQLPRGATAGARCRQHPRWTRTRVFSARAICTQACISRSFSRPASRACWMRSMKWRAAPSILR